MADKPRGVRNNNPGNLEKVVPQPWQGLSVSQNDPTFYQFDDAVYGVRALARQLIAYQDIHDCKTVYDSIALFAPPGDNNPTDAYASKVAAYINNFDGASLASAKQGDVNWHQYQYLRPALEAIIDQENGAPYNTWYTSAQLDKACVLAGVEPPKKSLVVSRQIIGGSLAAVATTAQPVVEMAKNQLQPLTDYSDYIKHAFVILSLIGVGFAIYAKIDERRKGIS